MKEIDDPERRVYDEDVVKKAFRRPSLHSVPSGWRRTMRIERRPLERSFRTMKRGRPFSSSYMTDWYTAMIPRQARLMPHRMSVTRIAVVNPSTARPDAQLYRVCTARIPASAVVIPPSHAMA